MIRPYFLYNFKKEYNIASITNLYKHFKVIIWLHF